MTLFTLVVLIFACTSFTAAQQRNYVEYNYDGDDRPLSFSRPAKASQVEKVTPVPILKQINRHNDDGSYTYGYEGADGSFKIETKLTTGEVMGKYGYVDDTGKLRVVDYGANRYGFQPAGEGITVAPPTLVDETTRKKGAREESFIDYDDGSYFAEPAPKPAVRAHKKPAIVRAPPPRAEQVFTSYDEEEYIAPIARPSLARNQAPVPQRIIVPNAAPAAPRPSAGSFQAPSPIPAPPPPRPAPVRSQPRYSSNGLLDQLAQQYALPQGAGQPLHDITFGSYSSQTNF